MEHHGSRPGIHGNSMKLQQRQQHPLHKYAQVSKAVENLCGIHGILSLLSEHVRIRLGLDVRHSDKTAGASAVEVEGV